MLRFKPSVRGFAPWSIARSLIEPRSLPGDNFLFESMPYVAAVEDNVIVTRDAELLTSIAVHGMSSSTTSETELDGLSATFAQFVAQTQGAVSFYVNRISCLTDVDLMPITDPTFAGLIDQRWSQSFADRPAYHRKILVTVGLRSAVTEGIVDAITRNREEDVESRERLANILHAIADEFVRMFARVGARRLSLSSGEWLGHLSALNCGEYQHINPTGIGTPIAAQVCNQDIVFKHKHFCFTGPVSGRDKFGTVMSLKQYPNNTPSGLYDGLDIPASMVVSHSFLPVPANVALAKASNKSRQMRSAKDAAESLEQEIRVVLDAVASGNMCLGGHHMSVTLFADSQAELAETVDHVRNVTAMNNGLSIRESYAQRSVYFAQHPGNQAYRTRVELIHNHNFSSLAAFHNRPTGRGGRHPWKAPLTHLRSRENETYALNLHSEMTSKSELTPGHTVIFGETGTGKTVTASLFAAQAQRFGARVFAFDYKHGMEISMRALGLSYSAVQIGETTGLNPFGSEVDQSGESWLASWIENLVATDQNPLTPLQRNAIAEATKENAEASRDQPGLNNFRDFASFFKSLDDDGDLMDRLEEWTNGRLAWMFDGQGKDPLSDPSASVCFDVTDVFNDPKMRTAWLSYIFRRIERLVEDGRPTLIILDEAPILLDDEVFEARVKKWLDVMRKQNAVVVLMAQRASQIAESRAGKTIFSACPTKIVFQHPDIDTGSYQDIGFTPTQVAAMKADAPNRHAVLMKPGEDLIVNFDLSALGAALPILASEKSLNNQLPGNWRDDPDFWRKLL